MRPRIKKASKGPRIIVLTLQKLACLGAGRSMPAYDIGTKSLEKSLYLYHIALTSLVINKAITKTHEDARKIELKNANHNR